MFVGHYAAAFVLKGYEPKSNLGWLFIAVQFVDILFFPFAILGLESLVFEKNFTAVNNFVMEYPFTHGLAATLAWSVIFYLIWRYIHQHQSKSIALVMALAVTSHWFTDVIVHTPDLPLISGEPKYGLGLWHNK
jgi:cell shape-determining protein MreD